MNKQVLRFGLFTVIFMMLAACNREAQPLVSPVGSWQGTLTTTTGGSGTEPFTAEITRTETGGDYTGVFTVGDTVYNVSGFYNGTNDEGEIFIFELPLGELQPTVSPAEFYGLTWSGPMTENTYSGGWFFNSETANRTPAGEFGLERRP